MRLRISLARVSPWLTRELSVIARAGSEHLTYSSRPLKSEWSLSATVYSFRPILRMAEVKSASENKLEPVLIHENALDALAPLFCSELV